MIFSGGAAKSTEDLMEVIGMIILVGIATIGYIMTFFPRKDVIGAFIMLIVSIPMMVYIPIAKGGVWEWRMISVSLIYGIPFFLTGLLYLFSSKCETKGRFNVCVTKK